MSGCIIVLNSGRAYQSYADPSLMESRTRMARGAGEFLLVEQPHGAVRISPHHVEAILPSIDSTRDTVGAPFSEVRGL